MMYQNPFTERFLVIAEKPSVARTIAQVLVCEEKKDGYLEGPEGAVNWCFGHLAEYAMTPAYEIAFLKKNEQKISFNNAYGLEQNKYSRHVQSVVTAKDLFQPEWI